MPPIDDITMLIQNNESNQAKVLLNELNELEIYKSSISSNIMQELCNLLKDNNTISTLNLYYSFLDDAGFKKIAEVIRVNSSITKVELGYNKMVGVEGLLEVIHSIGQNKVIKEVDISCNNFEPKIVDAIAELIERPSSLISIKLDNDTPFNKDDMNKIISAYKTNGTLLKIALPEDQEERGVVEKLSDNFSFDASEFVRCFKEHVQNRENDIFDDIRFQQKIGENTIKEYGFRGFIHALQKRGEVILFQSSGDNNKQDCQKHVEEFKKIIAENFFELSGVCSQNNYLPPEIMEKVFYDLPLIEYECPTMGSDIGSDSPFTS